jgi:hypothetical protein
MRAISVLSFLAAVLLSSGARAEPPEHWKEHHREASDELGQWARASPQSAAKFFEWDGRHTDSVHTFVSWAIRNPGNAVDFNRTHPDWPGFKEILEHHRPAAEAFMSWCRRNAQAAEDLMSHPRGLEWVGNHLYKGRSRG